MRLPAARIRTLSRFQETAIETALWATAFYAGLRRGELRALRVRDVDFDAGTIAVERGWDDKEGPIAPKSRAHARSAANPAGVVGTLRVPRRRPN